MNPNTIFCNDKRLKISFLCAILLSLGIIANAQFTTATQDGIISANEYGVQTDGQNQQNDGATTYFMSWDANNLYVAFTGTNFNEAEVLYLDYNPIIPVNGGTSADGSNQGNIYDNNKMMLPFRADFVLYFKNGYNEYRRYDGANDWTINTAFSLATGNNGGTNTCEIAIPWNTITGGAGRPAQFNWLTYKVYSYAGPNTGIYNHLPVANPNCACNVNLSQLYPTRYYNVLNTANGSATKPFSTVSFTYHENNSAAVTGGYYLNGGTFYDFTINDNSPDNNDNAPAFHLYDNNEISNRVLVEGNITITNNLHVAQGSTLLPADNNPGVRTANLTFTGTNGSIYNNGRIDANPEAANLNDWNNRRINFIFAGTTRLAASNLFKERWRMSNITVNAGASLLGPLTDSVTVELQWGTLNNLGTVNLGDGSTGFADMGLRGDWSQHNDYFFSGVGTWRMAGLLIGRNSSRLQPVVGSVVRLLVQRNFENYDEFVGRIGTGRIDVVMAGRYRQWLMGNVTETTGAATSFYNFEIDNNSLLNDYNNNADVWFQSFGGGNIAYFVTGNLTMRNGDLVSRHRVNNAIHDFTLRDSATTTPTFVHSNVSPVGSSFVDGPMKWEVQQSISVNRGFPIGKTKTVSGLAIGDARPAVLTVDHDVNTRTTYTGEMFLDDRSTTYLWPSPVPELIAWISQQRYWNISKGAGATVQSAQVTLSYDVIQRVDGVTNAPALRIVKDNGIGQWLNITPLGPGGSANNTGFITSFPFTTFSDFTLASVDGNMPLPMELLNFEAKLQGDIVRLDWTTAQEINSDHFVIERSFNRLQFHEISRLPAAGNSQISQDYVEWDSHLEQGQPIHCYRLKIVDIDGATRYSEVRTILVDAKTQPSLIVYPNPANGKFTLELIGAADLQVHEISILNAVGQRVWQQGWEQGQLRYLIDVNVLPVGTYLILMRTDRGTLTEKVVLR